MGIEWNDWDTMGSSDSQSAANPSPQKQPAPAPAPAAAAASGGGSMADARERHKLAERERRKSMRELFLSLHSLLPHSNTVRKEQSAILDEIIKYIPLAAARLRSLKKHNNSSPPTVSTSTIANKPSSSSSPALKVVPSRDSTTTTDCDIRVIPEPSSSVSIRVRGDCVNVSLTDTKGTSQTMLLSSVLDELESHQLHLIRSTHCRDGNKLLHHSECKICDGLNKSPALLKERLQDLACNLHKLKKSSPLKRSFDQLD